MEGVLGGIHLLVRTPCFRVVCEFVPLNSGVLSSDLLEHVLYSSYNFVFLEFVF